ncbi:MAG: hypothetical protein LBL80_04895 [Ruminococcus sp.]|jgi:hypothetical protein|nr:hypothetical protein [Ruminococcus sp.]
MIFLKYWGRWSNFSLSRGQKILVAAADIIYALTFVILIALAFAAIMNISDPQNFGIITAIFLGLFFVSVTVDIFFNSAIIRNISSGKQYRETLKLLETDEITGGNVYYYFNRTVRENIMYGNLQASEEDYNRALDTVALPERPIIEDSKYLSESDKQKIVLARLLISNPPELKINDILTHCDSYTKQKILYNIMINYPEITINLQ